MKISLKWIENVVGQKLDKDDVVRRIGAQLGAIEEVIDFGAKYDGAIVVKIITSIDHADSDHLHVCMIDDGGRVADVERDENGYVQVVCGAPNVVAGKTVAWLPPGSTVPESYGKDPFVLGKRQLRGVVSNGMLASPKELDLYDDHSGILEIDLPDVKLGQDFKELYDLDDTIIDCENKMFTHRPDCFGALGVAREIAGISGLQFKSPEWYMAQSASSVGGVVSSMQLEVRNDITDKVPRFLVQAIEGVEVKQSPLWLKIYLLKVGIKSINTVVDWSNYYMHTTGQPTGTFDYDKVVAAVDGHQSADVAVQEPRTKIQELVFEPKVGYEGQELTLLGGKKIKLHKDDIVIAVNDIPMALAGCMHGQSTEVDENTKNIIIECATFDMYTIRRTSMRHGIFTDAVSRFNKGQSPLQNRVILDEMVRSIDGQKVGEIHDIKIEDQTLKIKDVEVTPNFINARLGSQLKATEIKRLLELVEFGVNLQSPISNPHSAENNPQSNEAKPQSETLSISSPFWRRDVEIPEDIVEEVGRLYGYDKLPVTLPKHTAKAQTKDPEMVKKSWVRNVLSKAGANEVVTYSFVHDDHMKKVGQDPELAYHIRNAISPELQYYRLSLTPSLLEKINTNIRSDRVRSDDNEFALFEINKVHCRGYMTDENVPLEFGRVALVFAADEKTSNRKYDGAPYYIAKKYLKDLMGSSDQTLKYIPLDGYNFGEHVVFEQLSKPFEPKRSAVVFAGDNLIGIVGEYKKSVIKSYKLPVNCSGFEVFLSAVPDNLNIKYAKLSTYPKSQQDITFDVDPSVNFGQLENCVSKSIEATKIKHGYEIVVKTRDIFKSNDSNNSRVTFRIWATNPNKTMTTEEVNYILDDIAEKVEKDLNCDRI